MLKNLKESIKVRADELGYFRNKMETLKEKFSHGVDILDPEKQYLK